MRPALLTRDRISSVMTKRHRTRPKPALTTTPATHFIHLPPIFPSHCSLRIAVLPFSFWLLLLIEQVCACSFAPQSLANSLFRCSCLVALCSRVIWGSIITTRQRKTSHLALPSPTHTPNSKTHLTTSCFIPKPFFPRLARWPVSGWRPISSANYRKAISCNRTSRVVSAQSLTKVRHLWRSASAANFSSALSEFIAERRVIYSMIATKL